MQPSSIFWLCLVLLLGLGHSSNVILNYPHDNKQHAVMEEENYVEINSWSVSNANGTCILMKGVMKLTVNYTDFNNVTRLRDVKLEPTATASGDCTEQYIMISWQPANSSQTLNNTLTFYFESNEKSKKVSAAPGGSSSVPSGKYAITRVSAVIHKNATIFPNASDPISPFFFEKKGLVLFPTTLNHSFACDAATTVGSTKEHLTVILEHFQYEAYKKVAKDQNNFNAAEHCAADEISSGSLVGTVIISILGIVLVALGVAVVATYVLKKRRAALGVSGYQNM